MYTKEEAIEILNKSKIAKIVNIESFQTRTNTYIFFKDMDANPKLFQSDFISLNNKFTFKSFFEKTYFNYEHVNNDDIIIDAIKLETFYEKTEIVTTNKNNIQELSVSIQNKQTNNIGLSISDKSLTLSFSNNQANIYLNYDLDKEKVITYSETSNNNNFDLNLIKKENYIKLNSHNKTNGILTSPELNLILKSNKNNDYISDFLNSDHIEQVINYILTQVLTKVPYIFSELFEYDIINKVYGDIRKQKTNKIIKRNFKINDFINEKNILQLEEKKQKQLRITK